MRNLAGNFNTLVQDLSCGTRVDTNDRTADRGLSGTGLAYEGEGFSLIDVKRSIFYRFDCLPKVISTFFTCSKISLPFSSIGPCSGRCETVVLLSCFVDTFKLSYKLIPVTPDCFAILKTFAIRSFFSEKWLLAHVFAGLKLKNPRASFACVGFSTLIPLVLQVVCF